MENLPRTEFSRQQVSKVIPPSVRKNSIVIWKKLKLASVKCVWYRKLYFCVKLVIKRFSVVPVQYLLFLISISTLHWLKKLKIEGLKKCSIKNTLRNVVGLEKPRCFSYLPIACHISHFPVFSLGIFLSVLRHLFHKVCLETLDRFERFSFFV